MQLIKAYIILAAILVTGSMRRGSFYFWSKYQVYGGQLIAAEMRSYGYAGSTQQVDHQ
jgi:hypothetical protein